MSPKDSREIVGYASIGLKGRADERIHARLSLPLRRTDPPKLLLRPTPEQFRALSYVPNGKFVLAMQIGADSVQTEVSIDQLWFCKGDRTFWAPDLQDCSFEVDPVGVEIRELFPATDKEDAGAEICYWLSPNKALLPAELIELDERGERRIERHHEVRAPLESGNFTFGREAYWRRSGEEHVLAFNFVARCVVASGCNLDSVVRSQLSDLDDFLLVVSLATRCRVSCFGWKAVCNKGCIEKYLPERTVFSGDDAPGFSDCLVRKEHHDEFFIGSFESLRNSEYAESLKKAIYSLVPGQKRYLESEFLSHFSALEEILLSYRKKRNMDAALGHDDWKLLKRVLKNSIKESVSSSEARAHMYAKIEELNRVPLANVFSRFVSEFDVHLNDLWPVFGSEASLYRIRNRLTHGGEMSNAFYEHLGVAVQHMQWVLERIVLNMLQWPHDKSEVDSRILLTQAVAMKEFSSSFGALTEAWSKPD